MAGQAFDEPAALAAVTDLLGSMPDDFDKIDKLALLLGAGMRASGLGPGEAAMACCRITERLGGRPGRHFIPLEDGGTLVIEAYSVKRISPPEGGGEAEPPAVLH